MPLHRSMSDSLSASHWSLLSFELPKSRLQSSQFSVSEMLLCALPSPLSAGWQSKLLIWRMFNTCVRSPVRLFADQSVGKVMFLTI
jgi:hypothetical protein